MDGLFAQLTAAGQEVPANPFATHPNEDPDHLAARQARLDYATRAQEIRDSRVWSEDHKAEKLAELWQAHAAEVAEAYGRVQARRQTRLDYLNRLVPSGPRVPDDVSPADRAVLVAAFRAAMDRVQGASKAERRQILAEAERYGDDSLHRAVLQHATQSGDTGLVADWVARTHQVADWAGERRQLSNALADRPFKSGWDYKDFATPAVPPEVAAAVTA